MIIFFMKALHVVGFVSWFAGLFYLVRIFVYDAEAREMEEPKASIMREQYNKMEWRVYKIICNPAMWITLVAGSTMLVLDLTGIDPRGYFISGSPYWMSVKTVLLALLVAYHYWCKGIIQKLENDQVDYSDWYFRMANEFPTLILVAVSFLTVYGKAGTLNYWYLLIGMLIFVGLIVRGARAYKKRRESGKAI